VIRNHARLNLIIIVLSLFYWPQNLAAQSELEYADCLFREQDYFRAITEYKKLYYYSKDSKCKNRCLLQISKAYLNSNQYKLSIKYANALLNRRETADADFSRANTVMGLSYYGLKVFPIAEDYFIKALETDTTEFSLFYLALLDAERFRYKEASFKYNKISQISKDRELANTSQQLAQQVQNGYLVKRRNPALATLMSVLVPGSGQVYCSHQYDGLQAALYVGAFTFASYACYRYDNKFRNNYINTYLAISITGLFHLGNIIGARRTAQYFNQKQRQNFLNGIREKTFSIEY
jgi:tetratricopeptide (TPR) repeat protein